MTDCTHGPELLALRGVVTELQAHVEAQRSALSVARTHLASIHLQAVRWAHISLARIAREALEAVEGVMP